MPFVIHMKLKGADVPRKWRGFVREFQKEAFAEAGALWHAKYRPLHFTRAGARKYHYRRRSGEYVVEQALRAGTPLRQIKARQGGYTLRKLKKHGHMDPLVWSGRSRDFSAFKDIRATPTRVRIVMQTRALNFRPRGWPYSMREELTKVTQDEAADMVRTFQRRFDQRIRTLKTLTSSRMLSI